MTKTKTTALAKTGNANTLQVTIERGKTRERQLADIAVAGLLGSAGVVRSFSGNTIGDLSITDCVQALKVSATEVNDGDLSGAEAMLTAQAVALNSIFGELAMRAAQNMGQYPEAFERYMRLSLKAQGQARATLETLAAIKCPPVVFARQANINNGGQQQVNNVQAPQQTTTPAPAGNSQTERNELLEHQHGSRLDCGAQGAASGAHPDVEAMEPVHRATDT